MPPKTSKTLMSLVIGEATIWVRRFFSLSLFGLSSGVNFLSRVSSPNQSSIGPKMRLKSFFLVRLFIVMAADCRALRNSANGEWCLSFESANQPKARKESCFVLVFAKKSRRKPEICFLLCRERTIISLSRLSGLMMKSSFCHICRLQEIVTFFSAATFSGRRHFSMPDSGRLTIALTIRAVLALAKSTPGRLRQ
jgi:hypothetical protein